MTKEEQFEYNEKAFKIKAGTFYHAKHFSHREFACKCCFKEAMDVAFIMFLDALRDKINAPLLVSSGWRCKSHNEAVGGAVNSYHLKGMAADIYSPFVSCTKIDETARKMGFGGVKHYKEQGFVHVDIGPKRTW